MNLCNKYRAQQNNRRNFSISEKRELVLCVRLSVRVFVFAVDIYNVKRNTTDEKKEKNQEKTKSE